MATSYRHPPAHRRTAGRSQWLTALATVLIIAGCGSSAGTPQPSGSMRVATPTPSQAASSSPQASSASSPTPSIPSGIVVGSTIITVSDDLRVRSQPRVADDSVRYTPLLPLGTELKVLDGPAFGSGYAWFRVQLLDTTLDGGVTSGWVAAGEDADAWVAPSKATLAIADVARGAVDQKAARTTAAGLNAFGLELYAKVLADQKLDLRGDNVVLSPASVALALGMVRAGARGTTAAEMDAVLRTSGWTELSRGIDSLDQILASRNATWTEEADSRRHLLALRIANAAFVQQGWEIQPAYLEAIGATFGAGVRLLDFGDGDAARKVINAWVSAKTERRIPELLTEPPDPSSVVVLVNAVYLKAEWLSQFEPSATAPAAFRRLDGSSVKVATWCLVATWPYAAGKGWQAIEIPYRDADWDAEPDRWPWQQGRTPALTMTVIRPDDLLAFEKTLTPAVLAGVTSAVEAQRTKAGATVPEPAAEPDSCGHHAYDVDVALPRFGIDTRSSLVETLKTMGMRAAFGGGDLSGIGPGPLAITQVIHQANIDVDEQGTVAAAATAIDVAGGCTGTDPAKVIPFKLDRPFLFLIRDTQTGAILFMGRVVDPSGRM